MSKTVSEKIDPNRMPKQPFGLKAESTLQRITFTPSSANPGETLYVNIPKLSENNVLVPGSVKLSGNNVLVPGSVKLSGNNVLVPGSVKLSGNNVLVPGSVKLSGNNVLVPGSVKLSFNIVVTGHVNDTLVNNVGRNLVSNFKVVLGGETLQDTKRYDLFMTYQDLFLSGNDRSKRLKQGISTPNIRKLRSLAGDATTSDAKEVFLAKIYSNRYFIPIEHPILDDHGVFYSREITEIH